LRQEGIPAAAKKMLALHPSPLKESVDGKIKNPYFNQSEIDKFFTIAVYSK
jgi:hypothetical protein